MSKKESFFNVKDFIKMITAILSWTVFSLLILIGVALLYYVISASIYSARGEEFKPPFALYTIISPSMEPKVKVYDVILNFKADQEDIQKGDIITFISSSPISVGMTVTHRVIDIVEQDGEILYRTKGDNNTAPDTGLTPYSSVKGKTFLKIPQLGRIQFLLASKGGWFIVILIPALGIIIYDILKLFKLVGVKNKLEKISEEDNIEDENKKKEERLRKEKYKEKYARKLADKKNFELPKLAEDKEEKESIEEEEEIISNSEVDEDEIFEDKKMESDKRENENLKEDVINDYEDNEEYGETNDEEKTLNLIEDETDEEIISNSQADEENSIIDEDNIFEDGKTDSEQSENKDLREKDFNFSKKNKNTAEIGVNTEEIINDEEKSKLLDEDDIFEDEKEETEGIDKSLEKIATIIAEVERKNKNNEAKKTTSKNNNTLKKNINNNRKNQSKSKKKTK